MNQFTAIDNAHMARALRLAELGLFTTQPNPRVGCVVAQGADIVGEGFHARAGEPHAEVFALREAGLKARGATAYVTLEPCAHFGKTPPCADALIGAGIERLVAACEDPNPKVAGGGFAKLRDAGIAVEAGLLREVARELNRGFFSRIERGRPWLRVKLAQSLDGRTALANGKSQWISGDAARADVQCWRARSSAILTGSGTVLADNPRLTVRLHHSSADGTQVFVHEASSDRHPASPSTAASAAVQGVAQAQQFRPLRVVLDRQLQTPPNAKVLDGSALTLIFHATDSIPDSRFNRVECAAIPVCDERLDLESVLHDLAARGVNELQVEAGPTLCGGLQQGGFVDEWLLYISPLLLGDRAQPLLALPPLEKIADAQRLRMIDQRQIGDDWRLLLRE